MIAKARKIGWIDNLCMLNPPAPVAFVAFGEFRDSHQNIGVGSIANCVNRSLKVVERCAAHPVAQLGGRGDRDAAGCGLIMIWLF